MKRLYILNRVKYLKSGNIKAVETTYSDDLKTIQAKYHRNIGADMDDETLSGSTSVITDSDSNRIDGYAWGEIIEPQAEAE